MKKLIYIKYGELSLKGKNKILFINRLYDCIKNLLSSWPETRIIKHYDAIHITNFTIKQQPKIIDALKKVPGINLIIPSFACSNEFTKLSQAIVKQLITNKIKQTTFKVETKRAYKKYFLNSMEISQKMGGIILKLFPNYKVDVHQPLLKIVIEIKEKKAIFYWEKIKGCGGFPLGINGKILMLISGGIDSPVAANLLLKKGLHVDFLTFISPPHTDKRALDKVKQLIKIISFDKKLYKPKLFVICFTKIQHEIAHIHDRGYQITIMRRYFLRIAKQLAKIHYYQAIGTGESLGQVASQTLQSMQTIQNSIDDFMVFRPLLTYDKEEIITLAKKMGTYEISILPFADACSLFVPANPVTKPTPKKAQHLESELDLIEPLIQQAIDNVKIDK